MIFQPYSRLELHSTVLGVVVLTSSCYAGVYSSLSVWSVDIQTRKKKITMRLLLKGHHTLNALHFVF